MGKKIIRFSGIIGLLAISAMIFVSYRLHWHITWWYFVASTLSYSATIIVLNRMVEGDGQGDKLFRWVLGCHLAFLLLAGGLYLNVLDLYITIGLFVACITRGFSIPFMLFKDDDGTVSYNGVVSLLALGAMVFVSNSLHWHITWWYFLTSTSIYSIAIISINVAGTKLPSRLILGCHFAFLFLAGGLYLNFQDLYITIGVFASAIAIGIALPFMLFKDDDWAVSYNGVVGLLALGAMVFVSYHLNWHITWWYFVTSILAYSIAIISMNVAGTKPPLRLILGCHFAFLFLAGGLYLNFQDLYITIGVFASAIAIGVALPFIVIIFKVKNPMIGHLIVVDSGPSKLPIGMKYNLDQRTTIGRGSTNTIQINESFISAEHTRMWFSNGEWSVQDAAGSSYNTYNTFNGTFLNNQPIYNVMPAKAGDIIQVGSQVGFIRFKLEYKSK